MNVQHWLGRRSTSRKQRYSGLSRFVQNGFPKKQLDEQAQARIDWRLQKGFRIDQAKSRCWCKLGWQLKRIDHRMRRAYIREMLHRQDYDRIYDHREMFISSWDAC